MFKKLWDKLGLIHTDFDTFGNLFLRFMNMEPLMLFYLLNPKPQVWIRDQNLSNQVFNLFRQEWGESEVSFQDFLIETLRVLVLKREIPTYFGKQDDTSAP